MHHNPTIHMEEHISGFWVSCHQLLKERSYGRRKRQWFSHLLQWFSLLSMILSSASPPPSSDSSIQLKYYRQLFCILTLLQQNIAQQILWAPSSYQYCSPVLIAFHISPPIWSKDEFRRNLHICLNWLFYLSILDPASDVASHPVSWCQQWFWKLSENVFHSQDLGVLLKTWNLLFRSHLHILWNFLWWSTDQHIQQSDFRN